MVAEEVDYEELAALLTDSHVPLGRVDQEVALLGG